MIVLPSQMTQQRRQPETQLGMVGPRTAIEPRGPLRGLRSSTQLSYPNCGPGGGNGDGGGDKHHHPTTSATILSTFTPK